MLDGWHLSGIWTMRSGNPLTVFVQTNRSRSLWKPSLGPGIGQDRPSYAPGYGRTTRSSAGPTSGSTRRRSCCSPPARSATPGRGDFIGPNLRTLDLALVEDASPGAASAATAGSSSGSRRSTSSTAPTSASPSCARSPARRQRSAARDLRPHHEHGDLGAADSAGRQGGVLECGRGFAVRGFSGSAGLQD